MRSSYLLRESKIFDPRNSSIDAIAGFQALGKIGSGCRGSIGSIASTHDRRWEHSRNERRCTGKDQQHTLGLPDHIWEIGLIRIQTLSHFRKWCRPKTTPLI